MLFQTLWGTVVTSPEDGVDLMSSANMRQHILKGDHREVTLVGAPFSSSEGRVLRVAELLSAAEDTVALRKSPFLVLSVKVEVTQVQEGQSRPGFFCSVYLRIQIVNVVVI